MREENVKIRNPHIIPMNPQPAQLSSPAVSSSSPQSQSSSNSGSYCYSSGGWEADSTPYRGLRPARVVTQQNTPFGLRLLTRSPREILEKKAEMERETKSGVEDLVEEDGIEMEVEGEIRLKLFYLGMIHRMREGESLCQSGEVNTLVLRMKDMEVKMEQARRLIRVEEEQQEKLEWEVVEARQKLASLKMDLTCSKETQARTVSYCQARLVSCQAQLADAQARHQSQAGRHTAGLPVSGMTGQATSCTQFSNLFSLSGQLAQLCRGEQGSKWVVDRLVEGQQQERSLVRSELNLPQDLTKHLSSNNCRRVIIVLAEVDSKVRGELLRQTKEEIDTILGMKGGQQFVKQLLEGKD
eukprot:GFUD01026118.1.p1 GENE.GFUD01026118.1~~GFUD01026118.1.p1  ORF type:complete len:355 (+),score=173.77 GFUD01026118.1:245-1309(+)